MAASRLLLHYGTDSLLTEARVRVLEDAGYDVLVVATARAAVHATRSRAVVAVVACHSVPPDELEAVVREIKQLKPRVPIIVIHVGGLIQPHRSLADGFVDGLRGADHLLSQIASLIARNRPTAAAG